MTKLQIFCDFDGTIAVNDVGDAFFAKFGDAEACRLGVEAWKRDELSSLELYLVECKDTRVTPQEFADFLADQPLDPYFAEFVKQFTADGHEIIMLSDGFENYITPLLERSNLPNLPVIANRFEYFNGDQIKPVFPFSEHTCGKCANCKRHHVETLKKPEFTPVFVGDGLSDRCGAEQCEIVLAKNDLARYCEKNAIPYTPFDDFSNVITALQNASRSKRSS